jgi:hypothetical protein
LAEKEKLALEDGASFKMPVWRGGFWYINTDRLLQFLIGTKMVQITPKDLVRHLRRYGCVTEKMNVEQDDKRLQFRMWRLPKSFVRDGEKEG